MGRATCLALVLLLACLMVLHGVPRQQEARAITIPKSLEYFFAPGILEFVGLFTDAAWSIWHWARDNKDKRDPEFEEKVAEIKKQLDDIIGELGDINNALTDIKSLIDQIENQLQNISLETQVFTPIETAFSNFSAGISAELNDSQTDAMAKSIMTTYGIETKVRLIYNYISHKNWPRSALDKFVDLLMPAGSTMATAEDFSTRVSTTDGSGIVVERPTYFDYKGWTGGHDVMGATGPSRDFYFAEGTCRPGFDTYFCIQNPGKGQAAVRLTYMTSDGASATQDITVPGASRATVSPVDVLRPGDSGESWAGVDFSTLVHSTNGAEIIAERPMYFNYQDKWSGGHTAVGATSPSKELYFAEGTCRPGFDSYICIQNPSASPTHVKADFMMGDGAREQREFDMLARSRYTLKASDVIGVGEGAHHDFSAKVASTDGGSIVAERPMYFDYHGWTGGHGVMGASATGREFYFAEGTCRPGFDPYICLQNPGDDVSKVRLTYMKGDQTVADQAISVPAHSRATVSPRDVLGTGDDAGHDFSTRVAVTEGGGILAERPMYFNYKSNWTGGHNVMGAAGPRSDWYFAEGTFRQGFVPYFCIQNPGPKDTQVMLTFMGNNGRNWTEEVVVPASSRVTVAASDTASSLYDNYCAMEQYFTKLVTEQIFGAQMVMEAKSWNPGRYGSPDVYINNTLEPMLREETDCFRDNVERLVMGQAGLVNEVNNTRFDLGPEAAQVFTRANYICDLLINKALDQQTNVMTGTVIASTDVIPLDDYTDPDNPKTYPYPVTAVDKATMDVLQPVSTTKLRQLSSSMSEPYNATNWKGPGLVDRYYDVWSGANLTPRSDLTILRYQFKDVMPGHYYDIRDQSGKTIAANVPVFKYNDSFEKASDGEYVIGDFCTTLRGDGGGNLMMKNWTYTIDDSGSGCDKDVTDVATVTPKHIAAKFSLHEDESNFQLHGARAFTYAGAAQATVKIGAAYTTTGKFNTDDARSGDYGHLRYTFLIYDVTDSKNAGDGFQPIDWQFHDKTGDGDHNYSDSSADYLATGKLPAGPYTLVPGHQYELRVYSYVSGKAIGVMTHIKGNINLSLDNVYILF